MAIHCEMEATGGRTSGGYGVMTHEDELLAMGIEIEKSLKMAR